MRHSRFVTAVGAGCVAVVMWSLPVLAGQMPQASPPMVMAKPQSGAATPDMAMTPEAMMAMNPYFSALNYPVPQDNMMVMLLSDFQAARTTRDFFTGMGLVQYGLTPR